MQALVPHLVELRRRLIRCLWVLGILFLGLFWVDEALYSFIATPLLNVLPAGGALVATDVTAPFVIPMKFAFILSLFLSVPYFFYELWAFIAPGLYPREKQKMLPFLLGSLGFFYGGVAFAYWVICPLALQFFSHSAPKGVQIMTDMGAYLEFVLAVLWGGGMAFQVPIFTLALIQFNILSLQQLAYLRPYVIVGAFTLGMLLTPPDVTSQVLLALPMWGLFEGVLLLAPRLEKRNKALKTALTQDPPS